MESRILMIILIIALLFGFIFISGAGCGEKEASAEELDSELGDLENLSNEIDNLNINELNDTELSDLEGLI